MKSILCYGHRLVRKDVMDVSGVCMNFMSSVYVDPLDNPTLTLRKTWLDYHLYISKYVSK